MIGQNLGKGGGTKLNAGRKEVESGRSHGAAGNRHVETLLVDHDPVVMHRLIEMD